eukprot:gnl/Spiro4/27189_TR13525_c0_g1_i1.p1 gnl/Spiro4/27189_TR13525_c0_g1~~gnl/Spiro4/27189_TR13525_c0_g1_i1.p1  ORF type:complete len:235 (+),score=41.48 gnl/Spiro4/27189_TR13525_c0_g1_i1:196-900(+)
MAQRIRRAIAPTDPFFEDTNEGISTCSCPTASSSSNVEKENIVPTVLNHEFSCQFPGCSVVFRDTPSYEAHYNTMHRNVCTECGGVWPSRYLLELHIAETHDSYFAAMVAKAQAPMYACMVEGCSQKFWHARARRRHLERDHLFSKGVDPLKTHLKSSPTAEQKEHARAEKKKKKRLEKKKKKALAQARQAATAMDVEVDAEAMSALSSLSLAPQHRHTSNQQMEVDCARTPNS